MDFLKKRGVRLTSITIMILMIVLSLSSFSSAKVMTFLVDSGNPNERIGFVESGIDLSCFSTTDTETSLNLPNAAADDPAKYPGTVAWSSPSDALQDDGVFASATLGVGDATDALYVNDLGFNIPFDSIIQGIEVEIDYAISGGTVDTTIMLVDGEGNPVGTALTGSASDSDPTPSIAGGASDMWDTQIKSHDVNDPDFGVYVAAQYNSGTTTVQLDYLKVKVYYSYGVCNTDYSCDPESAEAKTGITANDNPQAVQVGGVNDSTSDAKWFRGYLQFDTSSLPTDADITSVVLRVFPIAKNFSRLYVSGIDSDLTSLSDSGLYNGISLASDIFYTTAPSSIVISEYSSFNLGQDAIDYLSSNLGSNSRFALGFKTDENICYEDLFYQANLFSFFAGTDASPELIVSYVNDSTEDYYPTKECQGVSICHLGYYCGIGDGFCPSDFATRKPGYSDFNCGPPGDECCDPDCGPCNIEPPPSAKSGLVPIHFSHGIPFYFQAPTDNNPLFWDKESLYNNILIKTGGNCLTYLKHGQSCNQTWQLYATADVNLGWYNFFGDYNATSYFRPDIPGILASDLWFIDHVLTPNINVTVFAR